MILMTNLYHTFKSLIISAAFGLFSIPMVNAIVARPGVIQAAQPDGSIVNVRLEGQFGNHRAYSSDGYLLTTDADGFYVFADCSEDGLPIATNIRVNNPGQRSPEIKAAISRLDQSRITDAFLRRNEMSTRSGNGPMRGPGLFSSHYPTKGEQRSIAILVNFSNKTFEIEDPNDYYTRQLNEDGFSDDGSTGSAREYFVDNSHGQFLPAFDVYGPVTLAHPIAYYGTNTTWGDDKRAHEMIIEACELLDDEIDFSQYDCNGDGVIDNVYVYYAGYGEADGGDSTTIWPHSYDIEYCDPGTKYMFDGVQLNHYACSNEIDFYTKRPAGIGTFTHEFSHVMGLPDLYSTDGSSAFTPGYWSILDVGSYNNNSCTPPNYSSFERYALDWMEPEVISAPGVYTLEPLPSSNKAYMIPTEKNNEYFLFENRQQIGNDKYIPGHGMLVWHIEFNQRIWDDNTVNNDANHQYVDLIEADNRKTDKTTSGDSFPGKSNVTNFTEDTKPAFLSKAGVSPGFNIVDIAESEDGIITFTVELSSSAGINGTFVEEDNQIIIDGRSASCLAGKATVFDPAGKTIATLSPTPVTLHPGLYIISTPSSTKKVIIK